MRPSPSRWRHDIGFAVFLRNTNVNHYCEPRRTRRPLSMNGNIFTRRMARRVLAALFCLALPAAAAEYPDHPVRMIVPFTPAGATDLLARLVGERLGEKFGQPVIIDNRPGAGANLGAGLAAHAPSDGYTLLMGPASVYAISAALYPKLDYDLVKDLVAVSLVANVPHVLLVNVDQPVKSVPELIQLTKNQPGALNIASQGSGTASHLEAELLKHMAAIDMVHVPYRGSAPALIDLIGGRTQVMFDSLSSALPQIRPRKLAAIAVPSKKRSVLL